MAGKFIHGHQVHTYPADKMLPPSVLKPSRDVLPEYRDCHTPTPNQRKSMKRQHTRKSRRYHSNDYDD